MKKFSKVLVLLLTLAILCTGLILAVSADEGKAETVSYVADGATVEGTLADAVANADVGTTVKLLGDCQVASEIAVTKSVSVDLNGYTLTTTCATAFNVSSAEAVFNVTGTGNIATAGTLVKATVDGAKIAIDGTGLDGITVTHTGTSSVQFINIKSNTLSLTNVKVSAKKGATANAFIENSGSSNITIRKSSFDLDFNNVNGWNANIYAFVRVGANTRFVFEDSAAYTRNWFIDATKMNNGTNESILIKNSTIRVNDNDSAFKGQRLALVFAAGGNTANGVVNAYDSLLECSGRMFASEVDNTKITVNAYGVTFKVTWSECDQIKNSNSGNINRRFEAVNLYNSESGNYCKIISIDGNIAQTNGGGVTAQEPGVRVNIPSVTTSTDYTTGIKVPGGTFAASSTEDAYEWVYDPIGDKDAPYVLVDKTVTTVDVADYNDFLGFDTIRFNKSSGKLTNNALRTPGGSAGTANTALIDAENHTNYLQMSNISGGTYYLGSEVGNSYLKYVVEDTNISGTYFITGKNTKTQSVIDNTGFHTKKVVVKEFDLGSDSNEGLSAFDFILQCRATKNSAANESNLGGVTVLSTDTNGKIINKLSNPSKDAYTQLNPNEWYRVSVVFYADSNVAYVYINGVLMGNAKCYSDTAALASADANSAYVQGVRFGVWGSSKVGSTICLDNISTRAYTEYQYSETKDTLSASAAYNYITTSTERQYVDKAVTVNGRPVASLEDALSYAAAIGSVVEANKTVSVNVKENVTIDTNGNNVTLGNDSYGFVKNGTNYTFNENYWYNAYYYTGDLSKISTGNYDINDFTFFGIAKLGDELNIPAFYTERTPNYANYTVNTQNGWVYGAADADSVLPKAPDLSDLALEDSNKNVLYLPLLESVSMTYVVKGADGSVVSYGISNDETHNAFANLVDGTTLVLLSDFTVKSVSGGIRYKNDAPIVTADGVKTVNGVVIDNDYTEEEIAAMRQVAVDYKIDLNGYTMNLGNLRIHIGQNVEFSIYSSVPGAAVNMVYKNGTKMSGTRTFNMALVNSNNWNETEADMLQNMNSRCNFGTYTDRDGNVVESEMFSMSGAVIFEAVSADSSCSFNVNNVTASRVATDSNGLIVLRYFAGKFNVENSILTAIGTGASSYLVDVRQPTNPEVVFENCLLLHNEAGKSAVRGGGSTADNAKNVIYRNCISSAYLNTPSDNHIYFGAGTASLYMQVDSTYDREGLVEAYCYEPMTLGSFVEEGVHFIKVHRPVYSTSLANVNYDNYYYFVDHGYAEEFKAQYPGVSYYELPVLTTKIVDNDDAVKVTFNKLDGTAAKEVYYVKGADISANVYNANGNGFVNVALADADATYNANSVTLTYTGWEALPTDLTEDVAVNPTYTVKAYAKGFKTNLSLYADFDINLYVPATYADYATIYVGENAVNTVAADVNGVSYLMATLSQQCTNASGDVVFTVKMAETVNGKLCEAEANVTLSITKYANAILSGNYTDADKVLMYYMLNYANNAENYVYGRTSEAVVTLLETYASYGDMYNVIYNFDEVCDTKSIAAAFDTATLDIETTPAFLFTLKAGFVGNVTVSYAGGLVEQKFEITADTDRNIKLSGMKVYNFGTIITITAEGEVNGEAVSVSGTYSLDTFAAYHEGNAADTESETQASSEECLPLIKSLFAYAEVAELYKAKTLADALVIGE